MKRILMVGLVALLVVGTVAGVAGCGGDEETTTTAAPTETTAAPTDTSAAPTADGAAVFAANCAACHAADGTGASGPDLTATTVDEAGVVEIVSGGRGSMPAYGDKLSADEIAAVAGYVVNELAE